MCRIKNLSFEFDLESKTKKIFKKTINNNLFRLEEDDDDELKLFNQKLPSKIIPNLEKLVKFLLVYKFRILKG